MLSEEDWQESSYNSTQHLAIAASILPLITLIDYFSSQEKQKKVALATAIFSILGLS